MSKSSDEWIAFDCLQATQPIGLFYVGVMSCQDVFRISKADVHRIDDRDVERMVGIQRELKRPRVEEIKQYVQNVDATFPTGIILAVKDTDAQYDAKHRTMRIRNDPEVADIIDGQHRIAGLEHFEGTFDLNVTLFVDMDLQDKAMTFATINLAQTKVNRSLVFNLYAFQKARSPQKTCHQIARMLHYETDSPLHKRIKLLGRATGDSSVQFITQATVVQELLPYITDDANRDRDALRRKKKLPRLSESAEERLLFRELFREQRDAEIGAIVWNLFEAVSRRWPEAWDESERGFVLNRTTGFTAIMKFLGPLYRKCGSNGTLPTKDVLRVLKESELEYDDFTTDNYKPGTAGATQLFKDLCSLL